jgi:hypothetical protein
MTIQSFVGTTHAFPLLTPSAACRASQTSLSPGRKGGSRIRVYTTTTDYWAINDMKMGRAPTKIARFLLDRGITGMKIYPFEAPTITSRTRHRRKVSTGLQ